MKESFCFCIIPRRLQTSSHDSLRTGCSPFPRPRRWALALRRHASFEAISRDTRSSQHAGHAARRNRTRNAAGTFSGHCQRSRRICENRSVVGRVSPTTSGSSNAAQSLAPRDYNFRTIERLNAGPGAYVIVRVDTNLPPEALRRAAESAASLRRPPLEAYRRPRRAREPPLGRAQGVGPIWDPGA